jgi:Xaa-Pro aminopeptidase
MNTIKPGVKLSSIYHQAQDCLKKAGLGDTFGASIGHSIGIKDVEPPLISPDSSETFKRNMVFCIEMWYTMARCPTFGVGVEDTGIVTEKGFERFTTMDRDIYLK